MGVSVFSKETQTSPNKLEQSASPQKESWNPPTKAGKPSPRTHEKPSPRTGKSDSEDRKEVPIRRRRRRPRPKNETAKGEPDTVHVNGISTIDEKGETSLDENTARSSKAGTTARSSKAGNTARSSKKGDEAKEDSGDMKTEKTSDENENEKSVENKEEKAEGGEPEDNKEGNDKANDGIPVLKSTNADDKKEEGDNAEEPKKEKGPPTQEEIERRTKNLVKKMRGLCEFVMSNEIKDAEGEYSEDFTKRLHSMMGVYFALKDCPYLVRRKMRLLTGEILHISGAVIRLCDVIVEIMDRGCTDANGEHDKLRGSALRLSILVLTNYSDCTHSVATDMADHPRYMDRIGQHLSESLQAHLEKALTDFEQSILKSCISNVHNVSMVEPNEIKLRSKNFTQLILPYLKSPMDLIRLTAICSLADIVDEKESELLQTSKDSVTFLINMLNKALRTKQHKHIGWSTVELARAVGRLARNDANKKLLVDMGCLPSLVELIRSDDVLETRQGLESVWALSFDEEVKAEIMTQDGLMDAVMDRYNSSEDKRVVKLSSGVIWTLRDLLQEDERYKDVVHKVVTAEGTKKKPTKESVGHIMVSYQWANQPLVKKISNCLQQNGFKVWIDVENMEGSTLQAMADAIENARVVLLCMTQKYKDSPNCRAEAEYAFQKRKKIVPLIMERGYKPDGWLGMILGAKLFYEFSAKYTFESRMDGLLREIVTIYGRDANAPTPAPPTATDKVDATLQAAAAEAAAGNLPGSTEPMEHPGPMPVFTRENTTVSLIPDHERRPYVPGPRPWTAQTAIQPMPVGMGALPSDIGMAAMTANNWSQAELQAWKNKYQLTGPNFATLTGPTVAFLVKMRAEAPEFFYRTVESRLGLTDLTEFANFIGALEDLFTQG